MTSADAAADEGDLRDTGLSQAELHARLSVTWGTGRDIIGRLASVDHKIIGRRYVLTAFFFLVLGGLAAVAMRVQLARPESQLIGPDLYSQLFSMHGTTMMFLFAVPVMQAFAVYLVPLMVGTRTIAFPRLLAFSYWCCSAACSLGGVHAEHRPGAGWFSYVPPPPGIFRPASAPTCVAQMVTSPRCRRSPLPCPWITTCSSTARRGCRSTASRSSSAMRYSFVIIFAMPAVMLSSSMLIMDRLVGTFFNRRSGARCCGSTLLVLRPSGVTSSSSRPGMVAAIVGAFASGRSRLSPLVLSIVATGSSLRPVGATCSHSGVPQLGRASHHRLHDDRHPDGVADLLLDRNAVGRRPNSGRRSSSCSLLLHLVIGGLTGVMVASCRSTGRCTTPISSSRISITC